MCLGAGIARIDENAEYRRLRHQFAQYFELLAAERGGKQTNACDIAAGPIETGDKSQLDRICGADEHNRYCGRRGFSRFGWVGAAGG